MAPRGVALSGEPKRTMSASFTGMYLNANICTYICTIRPESITIEIIEDSCAQTLTTITPDGRSLT